MANNYFNIGKLVATFGVDGEMVLQHSLKKRTTLKGLEVVYFEEKKDAFLPYFISSCRVKSDHELFIKLDGVNSREAAQKLLKRNIWIEEADFKKYVEKNSPIFLLGFTLFNEGENLGPILEVIEQPHQVLCRIDLNGNEALIPLHEETLMSVDQNSKEVHVTLPAGLLDLYR
ncbi:MAG TPA: ribosome maturation factor RimM [Parasegetibacter sp.]|jgi:16S rRNA processing protein RimM